MNVSKYLFAGALIFFAFAGNAFALDAGFEVQTIVSGLNLPTIAQYAPDGRLFIAEKSGTVKIFKNGALLPDPFITLTDINDYADRGLIGMALDPSFETNGYIYLIYNVENTPGVNPEGPKNSQLIRVTANGDTALSGSKVVILGTIIGDAANPSCLDYPVGSDCMASDAGTHSVDDLKFGPDGKLYVSIGDGSDFNGADPNAHRALSLDDLNGKVLRINPDGTGPSDNPFYTGDPSANRSKVWSYGLRNPFRMNFHPSTGGLFVGDVGWYLYEEINVTKGGDNFGWPCHEGSFPTPGYNCNSVGHVDPLYSYAHDPATGAGSVTGGIFYTGTNYPAPYQNTYFFGDFALDFIKRITVDENDQFVSVEDFMVDAGGPVDFFTDSDGNINYLSIYTGEVRRISYTTGNRKPVAQMSATPLGGLSPLEVSFSGNGSSDPDGTPLSYVWNFGDGATSTAITATHTYTVNGTYTATLTVSDGTDTDTKTKTIIVGNKPPIASIDAPVADSLYTSGQYIPLTGSGTDFEDGALPGTSLVWRVILHHNIHVHILDTFVGANGYFTAPTEHDGASLGDTVYMEVELTATDSVGLTNTKNISLYPAPPTEAAPYHIETTITPVAPIVGQSLSVTSSVANAGAVEPMIVDMEVFNASGTKVAQAFYENQNVGTTTKNYTLEWTPAVTGTYRVSVGFIRPGWVGLYNWNSDVKTFVVSPEAATSTALLGGALHFDGVDDYMETVNWDIEEQAGFTIEGVFVPEDISRDQYLISKPDATGTPLWAVGIKSNGATTALYFGLKTNDVYTELTGGNVASGERIQISAAFDGTNMILYKNGIEISRTPKAGPLTVNRAGNIWVGGISPVTGVKSFKGILDEMRVWNLPRTAADIAAHIDQELIPTDPNYGLIKYWKFNEGFGQDVIDHSNSGHHGVLGSTTDIDGNDPNRIGTGFAAERGTFTPAHQTFAFTPAGSDLGTPITLTETVTNSGDGAGYAIVDVEIYDQANAKVYQKYFDGEGFLAGQTRAFDVVWTPQATGTYRVSVGIMKLHWTTAYQWNNSVGTITVTATSTPPPPPTDTTLPTASITAPIASATVSGTTTVDVTAADNVDVAGVTFLVDGAVVGVEDTVAPYSFVWDTTTATNAPHTLTARARDTSNNLGTSTAVTVTVNNAVTPPPPVGPFTPTHVSTTVTPSTPIVGQNLTITSSVTNPGTVEPMIVDIEVFNTAGTKVAQAFYENQNVGTTTKNYILDWTPTTTGTYRVALGFIRPGWSGLYKWNNNVLSFTVGTTTPSSDTTLPTASITAPIASTTVSGMTTVNVTAGDNVAVAGVTFLVDGVVVGTEDTTAPYSFVWDTTTATNAPHTLTARARDTSNNLGTSTAVTVTVNNAAPTSATVIYGDNLASGWGNWSWNTLTAANTATSTEGVNSLQVTHQTTWGGLYLHHNGLDVTGKTTLSFSIFSGPTGHQNLQVISRDASNAIAGRANINTYVTGGTMNPNTWYNINIPLTSLNISGGVTTGLIFQGASGAVESTYSLDNIRLQ